jgi:hypothetical protein
MSYYKIVEVKSAQWVPVTSCVCPVSSCIGLSGFLRSHILTTLPTESNPLHPAGATKDY